MKKRISYIWLTMLVSLVIVAPVWAEIVTVEVTGVVDIIRPSSGFDLDGSINLGSVMNGSCIYDAEATPQDFGHYFTYPIISASITLGNYTFTQKPATPYAWFDVGYDGGHIYSVWSVADVCGDIIVGGVLQPFDNDVGRCSLNPFMKLGISSGEPDPGPPYNLPNPFSDFSAFDMYKEFTILIWHGSSNRFDIQGEITSLTVVPEPGTYYVDTDANGANDGSSWENAFNYLQDALAVASSGDQILVAEGIYRPDEDTDHPDGTGEREATFQLISGVALYGGYAGSGKPDPNARNIELYETILSGDLSGNDRHVSNLRELSNSPCRAENSYNVVTGSGTDANAILDGFTITAGCGNFEAPGLPPGGGMLNLEGSPTVRNCTFSKNSANGMGGGMYNHNSSATIINCTFTGNSSGAGGGMSNSTWRSNNKPVVVNCTFSGNSAEYVGGGMDNDTSSPTLTNCTFAGNSAEYGGGMFNNYNCTPMVTNCTFSGNIAVKDGGGICNKNNPYHGDSTPIVTNCILWNNSDSGGTDEYAQICGGIPTVNYNCIQGWTGALGGTGNIDADPHFAFPNDYHLMPGSPCIDAGTNEPYDGLPDTDFEGITRPLDGNGDGSAIADMGAYEYSIEPRIACSRLVFDLARLPRGPNPDDQILSLRNAGGGTMAWEIVEDCAWLEIIPTSGTSAGQINDVVLRTDATDLPRGYYICELQIVSEQAVNSPKIVTVKLHAMDFLEVPAMYPTIQAAIVSAFEGETIFVAPGVYTGPGNRDIDSLGKAITVQSTNPNVVAATIIDCNGTEEEPHRGFSFRSGEDANSILAGFTIINGNGWWMEGGGGIFCYESSPTITNCTITGNSADRGGGISCWESNPIITNCKIIGNTALEGGGMYSYNHSSPTITSCTFSGNSAHYQGGGMQNERDSSPTVTNCTFSGNSAFNGNALACWSWSQLWPSNVQMTNCILWDGGDEIWNNDGSNIIITYSDVKGGWPGDDNGGWAGEGNIDSDPCFVEPGYWDMNDVWVEGDYHLLPDSPCIDAGDNMAVPPDTTDLDGDGNTTEPIPFDLDGNPRIVDGNDDGNSVVDMGAYEYEAMVSCFGVNHVKLETKADKKGNKVELKGTFSPALPIDLAVDDVAYIIDDGQGNALAFLIPAGSFEVEGKPDKQKFKFHSAKGSKPDIKAKFDFDKCKFELKAKRVQGTDEITGTTLTIELWAGANVAQEVVEVKIKPRHLEYKREPKLSCCQKCKGIALLEVTSDQGVFVFEPEPGKEKLKRKTVVDDGVNGRVKIDTSCSKPIDVGDVFGVYTVTDLIKIFDDWPDDENDE